MTIVESSCRPSPSAPGGSVALSVLAVRAYQRWLSRHLGGCCRFHPTCSVYAVEALQRHGFRAGWRLAWNRLSRCRPGHPRGYDPVP